MFRRYKSKLRVEPCGVFFCIHIGKKVNAKQHVYWPYAQIKKWLCSFHCGGLVGRCGFDLIILHMGCHDRPPSINFFFIVVNNICQYEQLEDEQCENESLQHL